MAADYPYSSNPSRVKDFFAQIRDLGIPPKLTTIYLEGLGFKSKNDRAIIPVAKALGFTDQSGVPTELWRNYRDKARSGAIMASALQSLYSDLFAMYPDAERRDNEALRNFFSSRTSVGEGGLRFMTGTFKALAELGDFSSDREVPLQMGNGDGGSLGYAPTAASSSRIAAPTARVLAVNGGGAVTLNINIQLQIPDTDNAETYDKFFAAMKKHLLS